MVSIRDPPIRWRIILHTTSYSLSTTDNFFHFQINSNVFKKKKKIIRNERRYDDHKT